jgi:DNA replication protein DnaC
MMNQSLDETTQLLNELKLRSWPQALKRDFETLAGKEKEIILSLLIKWSKEEKANRFTSQIAARIKAAKFRQVQTIDNFDFAFSSSTQKIKKNYLNLYENTDLKNLPSAIFSGTAGAGKTHLSRALGYVCCQKGMTVLFLTAAELVNRLTHAQKNYHLETELNKYRRPQVLIIDELGYVTLDTQASNLFFQVISARHDQGLGIIATTNLTFGKFNQIFANDAIAHAIVDRLVNDAEVFYMEGPSYREHQRQLKHKKGN